MKPPPGDAPRMRWYNGRGTRVLAIVTCGAVVIAAAARWWEHASADPAVIYLQPDGPAVWVRPDRPFDGGPRLGGMDVRTEYRTDIVCDAPVSGAVLSYRALRTAEVRLDGEATETFEPHEEWDRWKELRTVRLPDLSRGTHRLQVTVLNQNGPALLHAWCDQLALATPRHWEARVAEGEWKAAVSVHEPWIPAAAREAPSAGEALQSVALPLVATFAFWSAVVWRIGRTAERGTERLRRLFSASHVRWGVMALWGVLAVNNELKLPFFGFDSREHSEYIRYLLELHRLPLAGDGWQMFQSPLYHLLGAAIYGPMAALFREPVGWHAVRLATMICGLLQVEVCYRAVRRVFPGRDDVQIIGTLVGGLMPMNVYISQALGNEPLAGLLSAMAIVIGLGFLDGEYVDRPGWWVLLGATWGLAMLAKVTPLLLGAPLLVMCLRGMFVRREEAPRVLVAALIVLGTAAAVCGWYYVRNWLLLGQPFIGGWDAARGIAWWQDPGYRTAEHFLTFGESLRRPIYAGHSGLWDGLYSTTWLDGYLLGTAWNGRPPWNDGFLISSAPLALAPVAVMLNGGWRAFVARDAAPRWPLFVSLLAIGVYLAAVASLYLRLPIYSAAKGTYLLGLLPCFSILAAGGCDGVRSNRIVWTLLQAALLTWATCVYASYFIM